MVRGMKYWQCIALSDKEDVVNKSAVPDQHR
jgi:hypothetical protein